MKFQAELDAENIKKLSIDHPRTPKRIRSSSPQLPTSPPTEFTLTVKEIQPIESKQPQPQNTIQEKPKQDPPIIESPQPQPQNTIQKESKQSTTIIESRNQPTSAPQTESKQEIPIFESKVRNPDPESESAQEIQIFESKKKDSKSSKRRIKSKRFSILSKQISEQVSVDYGESSKSGESGKHSDHFYSNQSSEDRYSHDDMMDKEMKFLDAVARNVGKEFNHLKTLPKGEKDRL